MVFFKKCIYVINVIFQKELGNASGSVISDVTLNFSLAKDTMMESLDRIFPSSVRLEPVSEVEGRVYRIADEVTTDDVFRHPKSPMKQGWEWITNKEFRIEFLYEISYSPGDILSENDIKELKMRNVG